MHNLGRLAVVAAFIAAAVIAAGAQCGDRFVQVKTMCDETVCYVLECQGVSYDICQDATGLDKMCGECDYFQAGACEPPGPGVRRSESVIVDPDHKVLAVASVHSNCALRGQALEEWISEGRGHPYSLQRSERSGAVQ